MTIDFGIDLGTTNSAIARLSGVDAEVVPGNDGDRTTASAVWIDRRGRLFVGRVARERAETDAENTAVEFKLRMGTAGVGKHFVAADRQLTPEELSAEVLKALRGDVRQRFGVAIDAAVVTVPAAFDLSACNATRHAATLAGLTTSPLLQEPTAAALAYGFQRDDDTRLLVYDLGGGTFDAAVVEIRDGEFTIANHRGDTFLGGKLIDWRIVEELLVPALAGRAGFGGLRRGDARWNGVIGRLKHAAERAKIQVSRTEAADILLDLTDADGRRQEFEYELTRSDVERLTEPLLVRSINLCRRALAEARLGPEDIARVLLVGGPTLSPYLRERLADPVQGLGVALDHSQDPLTVVARGAAIFAGTQRTLDPSTSTPALDRYTVQLEYQPIGPDPDPFIAGRLATGRPTDFSGYGVEVLNDDARPAWRSGRIVVGADGVFALTGRADRGRVNTMRIVLTDPVGSPLPLEPDTLTYIVGVVETEPPLTNAVGVGLDGGQMLWLLERATPLPARRRVALRTTVAVRPGERSGMIRIPVLEGEHPRADRNRRIGLLEVVADDVDRDVPEGSEVEVVIDIDASRLVVARAYVPLLDREFERVLDLGTETAPDHATLAAEAAAERQRLTEVRRRQDDRGNVEAGRLLRQIVDERIEVEVDELVAAAESDPDAATTGASRLIDLRVAIDSVETALAWPDLVDQAEQVAAMTTALARQHGTAEERAAVAGHVGEVRSAIESQDERLVQVHLEALHDLAFTFSDRSGQMPVLIFHSLAEQLSEMTDQAAARRFVAEGDHAVDRHEFARLRWINAQLRALLAAPPPMPDPFSTVRRR